MKHIYNSILMNNQNTGMKFGDTKHMRQRPPDQCIDIWLFSWGYQL